MINLAIQVLPLHTGSLVESYAQVDRAIDLIARSGLKYEVCPFETVIEGEYDSVMQLVKDITVLCTQEANQSVIINMKLHASAANNVTIESKMANYRK